MQRVEYENRQSSGSTAMGLSMLNASSQFIGSVGEEH